MEPKYARGQRATVNDIDAIERYGATLPLVGWIDGVQEFVTGGRHSCWKYLLRADRRWEQAFSTWWRQDELSLIHVKESCYRPLLPGPRFEIGMRLAVRDQDVLLQQPQLFPAVGWVKGIEPITSRDGQCQGWEYLLRSDNKLDRGGLIHWEEHQLELVHLHRYGGLLSHQGAQSCPWCLEHGRDPRWTDGGDLHPPIPDCQCWWHTHEEHMPTCPHRARGRA